MSNKENSASGQKIANGLLGRDENGEAVFMQSFESQEKALATLQEINATLISRNTELRKRNAAFSVSDELNWVQQEQLKNLRSRESTLASELDSLSKTCTQQAENLERDRKTISELSTQLEKLKREQASAAGTAELRLRAALSDKEQQITSLRTAEGSLKECLNEVSKNYERLQARAFESDETIRELERQLDEKLEKLEEVRDDFNRKLAKVTDEAWEKDLEIETLKKCEVDLKNEIESLRQEIVNQQRLNQSTEQQLLRLRIELATSQGEIEKLKQQCEYESRIRDVRDDRSGESDLVSNLKAQFNHELARVKSERANLEAQLSAAQDEIGSLKYELLQSQTSIHQVKLQSERAVYTARTELEQAVHTKNVRLQEMETQRDAFEREAKRAYQNELRSREDLERLEERARSQEINLRAEITKLQGECSQLSVQVASAREQMTELRSARASAERDLRKANETVTTLREAMLGHQGELQETKDIAAKQIRELDYRLRRDIAEAEARHESLQQELTQAKKMIAERERRAEALVAEHEANLAAIAHAKKEMARVSELSAQASVRESQLRNYSGTLTKEKAEVQKIGRQLVQEIKMLSATHPLKDYLSATEFELSKVELQLKTTPTLSSERIRLEECVAQLIDQRDFLKSVLAGSQKQFDRQAVNLEQLLAKGVFAPVPPPPPSPAMRKKSSATVVSEKAEQNIESKPQKRETDMFSADRIGEQSGDRPSGVRWEKPFDHIR